MGKVKDKVVREQDEILDAARAAAEAASPAPPAVPEGGGDEMNWNAENMDALIETPGAARDEEPVPAPPESGEHRVADARERDFERVVRPVSDALEQMAANSDTPSESIEDEDRWGESAEGSAPEAEEASPVNIVKGGEAADKAYPDLQDVTVRKVPHRNLVLEGVCTHCAHCGHKLTDAVSVQRGVGPVCSKKGYLEDFVEGDEIQAMIDLSEFPELVEFMTKHYKPLGLRGLVNGLVRVASLNRPHGRGWSEGNAKVHSACCDAIQSLGHKKMADLLRETLIIIDISEHDERTLKVWVKKRDRTRNFNRGIYRIPGARFSYRHGGYLVPVKGPDGRPKLTGRTRTTPDGRVVRETNKAALWSLLLREYGGAVARVKGKIVKVV